MMKTIYFTLLFGLLGCSLSYAQTRVTGTVTSAEDGTGVPFANIVIKGSSTIITTEADGKYVFPNVPGNAVFLVSSIGFITQEIPVNNRAVIDITLSPDATSLEEVVVVAFGTMKRKDITGSIASIKGDELVKAPVASMTQAMQGKMAGVQITSSSGSPGAGVITRVRGAHSITAGNDPLYVVDGIPMSTINLNTYTNYGGGTLDALASINPADIENIQVLKDASAAALYGSRASNGVILITTKSGKSQKAKVSVNSYYGVQDLRKKIHYLGAEDFILAQNEARDNYNTSLGYLPGNSRYIAPIKPVFTNPDGTSMFDTDWFDEVTRDLPTMSEIQVSTNGGNESTQFYLSASRFQQEGIIKTNNYLKYTFKARIDHRYNKRVKIGLNASYSLADANRVVSDNNINGVLMNAIQARPDEPIWDPNRPGEYYITPDMNPVALLNTAESLNRALTVMGAFTFDYNIMDNLTFRSNLGANIITNRDYRHLGLKSPSSGGGLGEASDGTSYNYNWLVENTLTYENNFGPLKFSAMAGQSFNQVQILVANAIGRGFVTDDLRWNESSSLNYSMTSSYRGYAMESYFGRLNLNLLDKYLIEGSIRSDASSKFAKGNRVGYFPAGSIGWKFTNESFFPKNNVLTDGKIRTNLGYTGNQAGLGYFLYMTLYSAGSRYRTEPGLVPQSTPPNPDLKWEKTLHSGIGVDLFFYNNRIEFTYDFYNQLTSDVLIAHSVPGTTGWTGNITENMGKLKNWGHEFSIFSRNIVKKDFQWNTTFNITFAKSEVMELHTNEHGEYQFINQGSASRLMVGYPISVYCMIKTVGIYQNDSDVPANLYAAGVRAGDVIYEDFNGDGQITADDRQMSGNGLPKMFGGMNNSFHYKGIDLGINLQWSWKNHVYTYWKAGNRGAHGGRSLYPILKDSWENRWTPENPHNDPNYPRFVYGASGAAAHNTMALTERLLQDGSYLRIKNVSLGYTLPHQTSKKMGIDMLRFYVSSENFWTFTNYDGFDPEVQGSSGNAIEQGHDFITVPRMRTFTFGININF